MGATSAMHALPIAEQTPEEMPGRRRICWRARTKEKRGAEKKKKKKEGYIGVARTPKQYPRWTFFPSSFPVFFILFFFFLLFFFSLLLGLEIRGSKVTYNLWPSVPLLQGIPGLRLCNLGPAVTLLQTLFPALLLLLPSPLPTLLQTLLPTLLRHLILILHLVQAWP